MKEALKVNDVAKQLGLTESAVRNRVYQSPESIPPWYRIGRALRWNPDTVAQWLKEREQEGRKERSRRIGPGRPKNAA